MSNSTTPAQTDDRKSFFARGFDPSFLLGAIGTIVFYAVVHQPSMRESVLYRYTTEHAVEYVIVALFIWGIIDIVLKLLAFPRELIALQQDWLPARQGREPAANAKPLLDQIRRKHAWLVESRIGKRLMRALEHVTEKGTADDYREHLQYLSSQDEDTSHGNYMLVRFVIGVTPVLGFLGTVVHFGTALSGISFDEMADRLPAIVGEMGEAFNTTTVALAAAMTMMFLLFICDRIERSVLRAIDRFVDRELLNRFEVKDANIVPFLSVVKSANEEALRAIAGVLQDQIDVWTQSLNALFQRFDERQQHELQGWQGLLEALQQRHEALDASHAQRLQQSLAAVDSRHDEHLSQIQSILEQALSLRDEFSELITTLQQIARGEGSLVELQTALADNLRVLHETQQIDKALHELSGAIHLLTARYRPGGATERSAA